MRQIQRDQQNVAHEGNRVQELVCDEPNGEAAAVLDRSGGPVSTPQRDYRIACVKQACNDDTCGTQKPLYKRQGKITNVVACYVEHIEGLAIFVGAEVDDICSSHQK
ncbi:MAG: hypothetical protein IIV43_01940, partial [Oscillospiraceae bacterium]|nr:hypothetical protein [Oscillospiraceae bacterium]